MGFRDASRRRTLFTLLVLLVGLYVLLAVLPRRRRRAAQAAAWGDETASPAAPAGPEPLLPKLRDEYDEYLAFSGLPLFAGFPDAGEEPAEAQHAPEPEPVVEPEPVMEPEPAPEPVLHPVPDPYLAPVAADAGGPDEAPEPEPQPEYELPPVAAIAGGPSRAPEPEKPEPERLPDYVVPPAASAAPPAAEPADRPSEEPEHDELPDYVVPPAATAAAPQVAAMAAGPHEEPDPDELPDYVIPPTPHEGRRTFPERRKTRAGSLLTVLTLIAALALFFIPGAIADHGNPFINLTFSGAAVTHNGARFVQGGIGAGTGNFDPFLTMSQQGNADTEKGYNTTSANGEFDTFFGGGRTHPISAAAIPSVNVGGTLFREFSLDANDTGADDFMSIDELSVYLDDQNNLTGYNHAGRSFGSDTGPAAQLIYDLEGFLGGDDDPATVLLRSQTLTPGSGVSDITVLLPDSSFPAECFYGSTTCGKFLIFYANKGNLINADPAVSGTAPPCAPTCNWNVTAGFEEWRTRLIPVVNVSKTADTSLDREFDWTVQKLVSTDDDCLVGFEDANTAATGLDIDLFNGQSETVCWKIVSDRLAPVDSNQELSGTITITNPTGGTVIEDKIDAVIQSVTDVFEQGGPDTAATVSCPVTFPHTLKAGETLTCTYSAPLTSSAAGTNTATANLSGDLSYSSLPVAFDPSSGTVNEIDASASLDDDRDTTGLPKTLNDDDVHTYTEELSCPSSRTESNTAVLTELDTSTVHEDPAFVNITCHGLEVSKDATPSYERTFDWTVKKYVTTVDDCSSGLEDDTLELHLFTGQSETVCWQIDSDRGDPTDSDFKVEGTITITNNAPIPAIGVSVADQLAGPVAATVDCDPVTAGNQTTVDVPATSLAQCSYVAFPPDATDRLNTATATLAGTDYTGTALADFGDPTTVEDETATLDDIRDALGLPKGLNGDDTHTYTEDFTCDDDEGLNSNTATLTEDDSLQVRTDDAAVNLTCHGLEVSKDATPSYKRTFDWTVKKFVSTDDTCTNGFVDDTLPITLDVGQSDTVCWKITFDRDNGVDSDFKVEGTITITNNAPIPAIGVSVADQLAGPVAATVDCDPVTAGNQTTVDVPATSLAQCSYVAFPPDATDRLNTATATLAGTDYTGTALADFGDPTTVEDETATLDDDRKPSGFPAQQTGDGTVTYTEELECGDSRTESNLATLTEDDSGQIRTDPAAVELTCVPVGEGCTPGYWKTHPTSWGPTGFLPTDLVSSVFTVPGGLSALGDATLLAALSFDGGPGALGGAKILLRAAVAALLNAAHPDVSYPSTVAEVIADVNAALASGNRGTMLNLAKDLDEDNNLGCPLS